MLAIGLKKIIINTIFGSVEQQISIEMDRTQWKEKQLSIICLSSSFSGRFLTFLHMLLSVPPCYSELHLFSVCTISRNPKPQKSELVQKTKYVLSEKRKEKPFPFVFYTIMKS